MFSACSDHNKLRAPNGTELRADVYELQLEDTSRIFTLLDGIGKIYIPHDSLRIRTDTIRYQSLPKDYHDNLFGKFDQLVTNSRNHNVKEIYLFENNSVYLTGYFVSGLVKNYTKFTPPLVVVSDINTPIDSTTSLMQKWNEDKNEFDKGVKTKSVIRLKEEGKIFVDDVEDDFCLYEQTISRDELVYFGAQELIVPDVIYLKSNLLYGLETGLLAEWGLRKKRVETQEENIHASNLWLEFTIYYN
ncbi:MAG: hypothetical protein K9J12_13085 [Melioribacteraceae bacterium]|nr:hypothetical protein [Melioribacteraceae bacterium]